MNISGKTLEQTVKQVLGQRGWKNLPTEEKKTIRELSHVQREASKDLQRYEKTLRTPT